MPHTPGPWAIDHAAPLAITARQPGHGLHVIAYAGNVNQEANARLIGAAPDLLLRVHERLSKCPCGPINCSECDADRAAIAKATEAFK